MPPVGKGASYVGYLDAPCTQPIAQTPLDCDTPTEAIDGTSAHVFAIAGPWTAAVYEMESSRTPMAPAGAYYELGAIIDPSSVFPVLTERTE